MAEIQPVPETTADTEPVNSKPCDAGTICPVCGGSTFEIRGKLHCSRCHTICETCCEGGRQ